MRYGYARVSSLGQSLAVQLERLHAVDCDRIFEEKLSGTTLRREQLHACLAALRAGDTLVITRVDRLARSTLDLHKTLQDLQARQVDLQVLDQGIDTTRIEGRLVFSILAAIAEFETQLRRERQLEGITAARKRGMRFGRREALSPAQALELRQQRQRGFTIRELEHFYGVKKTTIYKALHRAAQLAADEMLGAAD
jgi:DNA invertase Pin-like site-specific DNA recombinase